jgi:hypothetical protein
MALKTENCGWQALMDIAYDRWNANNDSVTERYRNGQLNEAEARKLMWGEEDHLLACTPKEREACILGKLNQQIENGGVSQWVINGYAYTAIKFGLWRLLDEMGETSRKIAELIRPFVEDCMDEDSGEFMQYADDDDDDSWQEANGCSDRISDRFYELQDAWHPEVYARLES